MHIFRFYRTFYACDVMNNFADAYEKTAPQQTESQRDYYYYTGNTTAQTPPPVWPTSGSNPNGTSVNPNGFDFKSTMEDVGNNLKDKAKELFGENHPSNSSQNQQPVRTAGTCPNCGAELEPGAEYCKKMRISGGKIKRIYNATKIQATVKTAAWIFCMLYLFFSVKAVGTNLAWLESDGSKPYRRDDDSEEK